MTPRKRPRRPYERWTCLECPCHGFGGLTGWIEHYRTTHENTHVTEARTS